MLKEECVVSWVEKQTWTHLIPSTALFFTIGTFERLVNLPPFSLGLWVHGGLP